MLWLRPQTPHSINSIKVFLNGFWSRRSVPVVRLRIQLTFVVSSLVPEASHFWDTSNLEFRHSMFGVWVVWRTERFLDHIKPLKRSQFCAYGGRRRTLHFCFYVLWLFQDLACVWHGFNTSDALCLVSLCYPLLLASTPCSALPGPWHASRQFIFTARFKV